MKLHMHCCTALAFTVLLTSCQLPEEYTQRDFPDLPREIYVINSLAETLSVIDPATLTVHQDVILTGKAPNHLLFYQDRLYVVNSGDNSITVYNESTFRSTGEIYLGKGRNPWNIIHIPGTPNACVTNFACGSVSLVDLNTLTVIKEIDLPAVRNVKPTPQGGCYADGKLIICSTGWNNESFSFDEGSVIVIDTATDGIRTIPTGVGSNPQSAVYLASEQEIHVSLTGVQGADDGEILVLDISTGTVGEKRRHVVGGSPLLLAGGIDAEYSTAYLSGMNEVLMYRYADPEVSEEVILGDADSSATFYSGAVVDETTGSILVTEFSRDSILVLERNSYQINSILEGSDGPLLPVLVSEQD